MAVKPASVIKFLRSAPLKPSVYDTTLEKSTLLSNLTPFECMRKISKRAGASGNLIYIFLLILPGLTNAGSRD